MKPADTLRKGKGAQRRVKLDSTSFLEKGRQEQVTTVLRSTTVQMAWGPWEMFKLKGGRRDGRARGRKR